MILSNKQRIVLIVMVLTYFLITLYFWRKYRKEQFSSYKPSIAVYMINFGNYRNELSNEKLDSIKINSNIDYYLFTDNPAIKSKKWKIIKTKLLPKTDILDSKRHTSKYVKFVLPKELEGYDIVVYSDSKKTAIKKIETNDYDRILKELGKGSLVLENHFSRNTIEEEIIETMKLGLENKSSANAFLKELKKSGKLSLPLIDSHFIIRKPKETNLLFENIYKLILQKKISRDQNIIPYAIDISNINSSDINYIDWHKSFKNSVK